MERQVKNIEDIYELSPMQQGMLFHTLYAPASGAYLNQLTCTIKGNLDIVIFKQCWQDCLDRHAVLRTSFHWKNLDKPVQVVSQQAALPWTYHDWREVPPEEQQTRYESFLARDRSRGFPLNQAPLLRCTLIRTAPAIFRFTWTHHHILMDGWCFQLLVKEVLCMYEKLEQGRGFNLPPTRPYRDFIQWLQSRETHRQEAQKYWEKELKGFDTVTPLARAAGKVPGRYASTHYQVELPGEFFMGLTALARTNALTPGTIVQGAWSLLFSQYSGTDDIMYGLTVSGRPVEIKGIESMIGLFINTLPVRIRIAKEKFLVPWLQEFQVKQAERESYAHCSLVDIQAWSQIPRGTSLFDTLLIYENYPLEDTLETSSRGLTFTDTASVEQSNYPLVILFLPGSSLSIDYHYDANYFNSAEIQRMADHFQVLLQGFVQAPDLPISHYSLLSETEKQQLLIQWNATEAVYPADLCIHEWYERQQEKQPHQPALYYKNQVLTYRELDRRANQLAHYLKKLGAGPDVIVGLSVQRSLEMIVGIMGILKAGGAYLPLDQTLPGQRLRFMAADTGIAIAVTRAGQDCQQSLPPSLVHRVNPDTRQAPLAREPLLNPGRTAVPTHLAYVIFTSGSTGKPKGVLLNHHGVCNFIKPKAGEFDIQPGDRILQFASLNFDASVSEIFAALLNGAGLVLDDKDRLSNPGQLREILKKQRVNIMKLPPVVLRLLPGHDLPALKIVISAGEMCTPDIAEKWQPGRRFLNAYGPTEASVINTIHRVRPDRDSAPPPIGKPIANTRVYILDRRHQPVPILVPGELCISGVGLARGYLNRPALTSEKFIPNPYRKTGAHKGNKHTKTIYNHMYRYMYCTGDQVRWQPGGEIEFLGRSDHQVKIRGFRVETGEIEAQLLSHPRVRQAAVLLMEKRRQDPQLAAFVVMEPGEPQKDTRVTRLRSYLQGQLPHYMVPSLFKIMEALPLTTSGKIDRRELARLSVDSREITREKTFIPPRDTIEFKLCQVWEEVLQVQPVGIRDDFFELGGHSLLAVRLMSRIGQVFGRTPLLTRLLETPTVEGAARLLQEKDLDPGKYLLLTFTAPGEQGASQPFLFCIHPAAASVTCYRELALSLGRHQPCCGLEAPGLLGLEAQHTIEEMARFHLRTLKQVQAAEPYYLLGWSFGGLLAFEMASQLEKQGERAALVALVDTAPPCTRENLAPGWETAELLSFTHRLEQGFGLEIHLNPDLSPGQARELSTEQLIHLIMETARSREQFQDRAALDYLHRWLTVFKTNCRAAASYNPQPYTGKIVMFRAGESNPPGLPGPGAMQWEQLAGQGLEVHIVPGSHFSLLEPPHVHTLARLLSPYLEKKCCSCKKTPDN